MENIEAKAIKQMPFAWADKDDGTVVFRFECHDATQHTFACPPDSVPEIVARLLAACEESAKVTGIPAQAIVAQKSTITTHEDRGRIGLTLYPTEKTGIAFDLGPEHAQSISSGLAHAAATVHPQTPGKQH